MNEHSHAPEAHHHHEHGSGQGGSILAIRCPGGLSGDMLLSGLAVAHFGTADLEPASSEAQERLNARIASIMPGISLRLVVKTVNGIAGWHAAIDLPHEHEHRNLEDIEKIIHASGMEEPAKRLAADCFRLLASCEAKAHHIPLEQVHFHEVGALDSILDICAVCSLYVALGEPQLYCSPLPVADGTITCAHGILAAPAPAVLHLLKGVPVRPFAGACDAGELVTPTAISLLRTLNAHFGHWPEMLVEQTAIVYGGKIFKNAPNGALFVLGKELG